MNEEQKLRMHCISILNGSFGGRKLMEEAKKLADFIMSGVIHEIEKPAADAVVDAEEGDAD